MKRINFKKVTVQNFLSIGQEPIEVEFKEGLNIITGFNRDENDIKNGVGKSSLLQSIYFAIFGQTTNDLPKQFIPNRKIGRNCKVTLEFEDISPARGSEIFVIERSLAPSKVRVWKNGEEKTKSSIPETNRYIKEVLSANEEVFQDCIFMRANSTVPFMAKKKVDKKNFIESIFDLSVFSDMLKMLKEDVRETRRSYDISNSEYNQAIGYERQYKESLADIERKNKEAREQKANRIEAVNCQIAKTERVIDELKSKVNEVDTTRRDECLERVSKCDEFIRILIQKEADYNAEVRRLASEYKQLNDKGDICPTCKRPYDSSDNNLRLTRMNELRENGSKLKTALTAIKEKMSTIENQKKEANNQLESIRQALTSVEVAKERIRANENNIAMMRRQIEEIENQKDASTDHLIKLLESCQQQLNEKKAVVDNLEQELSKLNVCEFILSDVGVRKFIVGELLDLLNGRIKYYLKAFKSTFDFTFDDKFEESIRDTNGVQCMYANCSGAESKKIDLAISFAFLDVLKFHQQVEYNIAFYDEILDSSVDSKSLEGIIEFINTQSFENNKCSYIVTHKGDVPLPSITEVILLEKVNGFTRKVDE